MAQIASTIPDYPREEIHMEIPDPDLDFSTAKDLAKEKARTHCSDPMLLSWLNGKTGEFYPNVDCGAGKKPAWIVFAESRGGNLLIDVNGGEYVFFYLML